MNTNIVIPVLYFFQISPKFQEETRRLIIIPQKPHKKKVVLSTILIIKEEEELYADIYQPDKNTVDINHALLQMPK